MYVARNVEISSFRIKEMPDFKVDKRCYSKSSRRSIVKTARDKPPDFWPYSDVEYEELI